MHRNRNATLTLLALGLLISSLALPVMASEMKCRPRLDAKLSNQETIDQEGHEVRAMEFAVDVTVDDPGCSWVEFDLVVHETLPGGEVEVKRKLAVLKVHDDTMHRVVRYMMPVENHLAEWKVEAKVCRPCQPGD